MKAAEKDSSDTRRELTAMRMTVADVMTSKVVSVAATAPFKDIAEALITGGISAVPVVDDDDHVLGMVSEADLLRKEEFREEFDREGYRPPLRARIRHAVGSEGSGYYKALGEKAGELMTSPARTTTPDAPVVLAARQMDKYGVKRLPVVDTDGRLVGIVSRRDLIKVFLRQDTDIAGQVRETVHSDALGVEVTVTDGVVTLSGTLNEHSQAITAVRLTENIDGVVAVHDNLSWKHDDIVNLPMWGGA
ncbi:CBS domain-containing protein [Nonomuraea lactucae]|uniref:CBS domain-containing protein n=1 Tax=Nonomuraea lactucae TaxID=2249762 RepID=UPI001F068401|nr:CBS domain-containing protein [Nonomuraea lactucae]